MDGDFWLRISGLVVLLTAMFVFPVVTLIRDERRVSRQQREQDASQAASEQ